MSKNYTQKLVEKIREEARDVSDLADAHKLETLEDGDALKEVLLRKHESRLYGWSYEQPRDVSIYVDSNDPL